MFEIWVGVGYDGYYIFTVDQCGGMKDGTLYLVLGRGFTAGFVCKDGKVRLYAPILKKWVLGQREEDAVSKLKWAGFKVDKVENCYWDIMDK